MVKDEAVFTEVCRAYVKVKVKVITVIAGTSESLLEVISEVDHISSKRCREELQNTTIHIEQDSPTMERKLYSSVFSMKMLCDES
jgi:uncharacterized protein YqgV (UPF0045/DUF77 family)